MGVTPLPAAHRNERTGRALVTTRYPLAPLLDGPIKTVAQRAHIAPDVLRKYKQRGMTWLQADRVAIALGRHPADVWPTWVDDALADAEIDALELVGVAQAATLTGMSRDTITAWLRSGRIARHDSPRGALISWVELELVVDRWRRTGELPPIVALERIPEVMEAVSRAVEAHGPIGYEGLRRYVPVGHQRRLSACRALLADGYLDVHIERRFLLYRCHRPYRASQP